MVNHVFRLCIRWRQESPTIDQDRGNGQYQDSGATEYKVEILLPLIYTFMTIITITREIHRRNKIIGMMLSVIIASSRKVTLAGNISTDWSGTCLTQRQVQGGI